MMSEENSIAAAYTAAKNFLRDDPKRFPLLMACVGAADRTQGRFAGAWVLQEARKFGVGWFPNLRPLVSYGILERTHVSRAGRRAYYVMPDIQGVKAALEEFQPKT